MSTFVDMPKISLFFFFFSFYYIKIDETVIHKIKNDAILLSQFEINGKSFGLIVVIFSQKHISEIQSAWEKKQNEEEEKKEIIQSSSFFRLHLSSFTSN